MISESEERRLASSMLIPYLFPCLSMPLSVSPNADRAGSKCKCRIWVFALASMPQTRSSYIPVFKRQKDILSDEFVPHLPNILTYMKVSSHSIVWANSDSENFSNGFCFDIDFHELLKSLVHCFVWNDQYFEKSARNNKNFQDAPENFIIQDYVHGSL